MEIMESVMWVLAGFIPTLAVLEALSLLYKGTRKAKYAAREREVIA